MLNVRLLLPKQSTGACIGKGGVRMKEIRSECGAKIKIDDVVGGAPERLITIFGTVDAITHACQKMAEFIYNEFKDLPFNQQPPKIKGKEQSKNRFSNEDVQLCLVVPAPQVGSIIGKGMRNQGMNSPNQMGN